MGSLKLYFDPATKTKTIKKTGTCSTTTETQKESYPPYDCEAGDQMILTLKDPGVTTNGSGFILADLITRTYENGQYVYYLQFEDSLINISGISQCDVLEQCCAPCGLDYVQGLFAAGDISALIEVGTFTPAGYDGNGDLNWAVATPTDNRYIRLLPRFLVGSTQCQLVWLSLTAVSGTTSGTTNSQLRVQLPSSITLVGDNTVLPAQGQAGGSFVGAFAITKVSANEIHGYKSDGSNWGIAANTGFNFSGFVIAEAA